MKGVKRIIAILLMLVMVYSISVMSFHAIGAESLSENTPEYISYQAERYSDSFSKIFGNGLQSYANTYYKQMCKNETVLSGKEIWEAAHIAISPTYSVESGMITKRDMYRMAIFDVLGISKSNGKYYEAIETINDSRWSYIFGMAEEVCDDNIDVKELKNFEVNAEDLNFIKESANKAKCFKSLGKISDFLSFCTNMYDAINVISCYQSISEMKDGTEEVLRAINDDASNPWDLRLAALDCIGCFNSGYDQMLASISTGRNTITDTIFSEIINQGTDIVWDSIVELIPGGKIVFGTVKGMRVLSNTLFNMDDICKTYYQFEANVTIENVIRNVMNKYEFEYACNPNIDSAIVYMRAANMYKNIILKSYDCTIEMLENKKNSGAIQFAKIFGYDDSEITELIDGAKTLQNTKKKLFYEFDRWIFSDYVKQFCNGYTHMLESYYDSLIPSVDTISLNGTHSAVILNDGSLYTWGDNEYGQLGDGTTTKRYKPTKIFENVVSISMGGRHSAAITTDGSLYLWGDNRYGQLGDGTYTNSKVPKKIMSNVASVALGYYNSAAIKTDGTLYVWGRNNYGQVGIGYGKSISSPCRIMENVASVDLGEAHCVALKTNGDVYSWGWNYYRQLGDGTNVDRKTPKKILENVKSISAGSRNGTAILNDDSLLVWGYNNFGQCGIGKYSDGIYPTKIMDNVLQAKIGSSYGVALLKNKELYTWGTGHYGELGNGESTSVYWPYCSLSPQKIMDDIIYIGVGKYHCSAIDSKNNLYLWGNDRCGQIGLGYTTDDSTGISTPQKVLENIPVPEKYKFNYSNPTIDVPKPEFLEPDYTDTMETTTHTSDLVPTESTSDSEKAEPTIAATDNFFNPVESTTSNAEPSEFIENTEPSTINTLLGDTNFNGNVDIKDATLIQKYLANIVDFNDEQLATADTNSDGSVSIADATQIQRYLAQLIPSLG